MLVRIIFMKTEIKWSRKVIHIPGTSGPHFVIFVLEFPTPASVYYMQRQLVPNDVIIKYEMSGRIQEWR